MCITPFKLRYPKHKMSSGHGFNSKQGRCYPFWTEVSKCREQPNSTPKLCSKYVEDFMECLFHKKEVIKLKWGVVVT